MGEVIDSVLDIDCVSEGSGRSSRFELTASTKPSQSWPGNQWWSQLNGRVQVDIFLRPQANDDNILIFQGLADSVTLDPVRYLVHVQGRDYSSILKDATYQYSFTNQTASEIAYYIAARHGFNTNIATTTTLVGSYQQNSYNNVILNAHSGVVSEWDLLTGLASLENFELFVDGTTLVFAPQGTLSINQFPVHRGDVSEMRFRRQCALSVQERLVIKSWNTWLATAFDQSDQLSLGSPGSVQNDFSGDGGLQFSVIRPNLSPQSISQMAKGWSNRVNQRRTNIEMMMPGDTTMSPYDIISLPANETAYETEFIIQSIRRHYSATRGFVQYVKGYASPSPLSTDLAEVSAT